MALKLNISNLNTLPMLDLGNVNDIYIRISAYNFNGNNCDFRVDYYCNETTEKLEIQSQYFNFEVVEDGSENDVNTRQQAYKFLKTLPEFLDCEDC